MRRIRRKQRYTWMPTLGGSSSFDEGSYPTSYFGSSVDVQGAGRGPTDLYVTPIVPDATSYPGDVGVGGETLRDFTEGQDWLCKRIVGKLCVGMWQIPTQTAGLTPPYAIVGAGFFVKNFDEGDPSIPEGGNAEIDPLGMKNIRQPWLWRRTWILTNASAEPTAANPFLQWTHLDNGSYNTSVDGMNIDTRGVSRRIRREERLFFVLNAYGINSIADDEATTGQFSDPGRISFNLDYRILGAMRRSNNRSVF